MSRSSDSEYLNHLRRLGALFPHEMARVLAFHSILRPTPEECEQTLNRLANDRLVYKLPDGRYGSRV